MDTEETATSEFDHNLEGTQLPGRGTTTILEEEEEDRSNANKHPRVSLDDAHTSQDNTKEDNSSSQSNCTQDAPSQKVDNAPQSEQTSNPSLVCLHKRKEKSSFVLTYLSAEIYM